MWPILWRGAPGSGVGAYEFFTVVGWFCAISWLASQRRRMLVPPEHYWPLMALLFFSSVLGAKLGFFLVEWREFTADPWTWIADWKTGWVFWTGAVLGLSVGKAYQLWHEANRGPLDYFQPTDYFMTAMALGQGLGRIGCFLEGCCHGRPAPPGWGVVFTNPASSVDEALWGVPLHPVQLYEAAGLLLSAAALMAVVLPRTRAGELKPGTAFLGHILYYAVLRFGLEFLRGDDRGFLLGAALSPSQWISLGAGLASAALLARRGLRAR